MGLPYHPPQDDDAPIGASVTRRTKVIIAIVVTLIIVLVLLHLTGVIKH